MTDSVSDSQGAPCCIGIDRPSFRSTYCTHACNTAFASMHMLVSFSPMNQNVTRTDIPKHSATEACQMSCTHKGSLNQDVNQLQWEHEVSFSARAAREMPEWRWATWSNYIPEFLYFCLHICCSLNASIPWFRGEKCLSGREETWAKAGKLENCTFVLYSNNKFNNKIIIAAIKNTMSTCWME